MADYPHFSALTEQLRRIGRLAVAFSGGTDSMLLLAAAQEALGIGQVLALTASGILFPEEETQSAVRFCESRGIAQQCIPFDPLSVTAIAENPPDRCYYCKHTLFSRLKAAAAEAGFPVLADGTNTDDASDYRPGMRAAEELGICSPLRDAGLSKAEIRAVSREMGLPAWNRPAAACLASRIPYGEPLTAERLSRIAQAEDALHAMGFVQVRVRDHGLLARIEVSPDDLPRLTAERAAVSAACRAAGYTYIAADLDGYRTGSLNAAVIPDIPPKRG